MFCGNNCTSFSEMQYWSPWLGRNTRHCKWFCWVDSSFVLKKRTLSLEGNRLFDRKKDSGTGQQLESNHVHNGHLCIECQHRSDDAAADRLHETITTVSTAFHGKQLRWVWVYIQPTVARQDRSRWKAIVPGTGKVWWFLIETREESTRKPSKIETRKFNSKKTGEQRKKSLSMYSSGLTHHQTSVKSTCWPFFLEVLSSFCQTVFKHWFKHWFWSSTGISILHWW